MTRFQFCAVSFELDRWKGFSFVNVPNSTKNMYLENLTGGSESVISRILSDTLSSTLECFEACGDGDNGDN